MADRIRGRQHPDGPIAMPWGLMLEPFPLIPFDLATARVPPEFVGPWCGRPPGQTAAERVKAILEAAGFGIPKQTAPAKTCDFRINVDGEPVFICTEAPHPDTPHLHAMLDGHTGELLRCKHYGAQG